MTDHITARIMYVNYPEGGKRFGSIKTDHSRVQRISATPDKLNQFTKGNVYEISYTTTDRGYFNLVEARPQGPQAPQPAPNGARRANGGAQRYASPAAYGTPEYTTGKQICVTGVTQRAVQTGKFTVEDIRRIMLATAAAYDEVFGHPQRQDTQPRDEIPPVQSEHDYDLDDGRPPF